MLSELTVVTAGAVALITGRPVHSIDRLFAPLVLPVAGQHGFERRGANGELMRREVETAPLNKLMEILREFVHEHPQAFVEDKTVALALHFRRDPRLESHVERLASQLAPELGSHFHLQRGKMVLEIKPSGHDKGTAIEEFMAEAPFQGRIPVFLGDDETDEDGFRMVNQMNGVSLKIGPGPTVASWRLDHVEAAVRWLQSYLHRFRKGDEHIDGTNAHES